MYKLMGPICSRTEPTPPPIGKKEEERKMTLFPIGRLERQADVKFCMSYNDTSRKET